MADANSIPMQKRGVNIEDMDGELILYHQGTRKSIHLNESAAVVWKLCDSQRTVQQIIDVLAEAYPDAKSRIQSDVWYSINGLMREGALRLLPPGSEKPKAEA